MRHPLISLNRLNCRVVLIEGDGPDALSYQLHGLVARHFASHGSAMSYLSFWRGDVNAMADLRFALHRSGSLPAGPRGQGPESLLSALADQLIRGALLLYESHLLRTAPGRLSLPPSSGMSALASLPALAALPSVPELPPLLPALEDLRIEGAEVMPEVQQSLAAIQASLGSVADLSTSLEPAPNEVPAIQTRMADSSAQLKGQLDAL